MFSPSVYKAQASFYLDHPPLSFPFFPKHYLLGNSTGKQAVCITAHLKWLLFNFCKSSTLEEWRISRLPPGLLSETIHSENKMMRRDWAVLPSPLRGGKKRKTTEKTALPSPLALNLSKEGTKSRLIRFYFMVISVFPSAPFFHD